MLYFTNGHICFIENGADVNGFFSLKPEIRA